MNISRKAVMKILVVNDKEMGKRLKEARKSLGINQMELAKRLKVSQAEISNVERGSKKPIEIYIYTQALGVRAETIINGK